MWLIRGWWTAYDEWARIKEKRVEIKTLLSMRFLIRITNVRENGRHQQSFFFFFCHRHVFPNHSCFYPYLDDQRRLLSSGSPSPHAIRKSPDHIGPVHSYDPRSRIATAAMIDCGVRRKPAQYWSGESFFLFSSVLLDISFILFFSVIVWVRSSSNK